MTSRYARAGMLAACFAATILFAAGAHAQGFGSGGDAWHGFYAGGGLSYSTVSVEVGGGCYDDECWWGDYDAYEEGEGAYSYAVHAGYRINRYIALEANYIDTGNIRWDENFVYFPEFNGYYNNRVDFSTQMTEVAVLGIFPFADVWEVYLRLGAGFSESTSEQRIDDPYSNDALTRSIDESGSGLLVGVGVGVTLAEVLHLRLDLQSVTIDGDVLNTDHDASLDSILVELQYRFGARKAPTPVPPSGPPTATP